MIKLTKLFRVALVGFMFLILIIVTSCNSGDNSKNVSTDFVQPEALTKNISTEQNNISSVERKIIKSGNIRFETQSVKETQEFIRNIVSEFGGYLGNEDVYNFEDRIEHTIEVRVPEDKFNVLVDKISSSVEKLESKNISTTDVTEDFLDVEARIKTKKELEARYKEILKKATRVDEILNIEREMGNLRSEIESLEGRMNYLKNRIALSSLTITFYEKVSSPFGFFSKIKQALYNGWNAFLWFIIILISLWPFIIIILITLLVILKLLKKKKITQ
ncbi:DUF4349 domain-containing protein [Ignavibacterium sp.]|uniref:DUF4349 domain-containing protein n=1 Tax=Ignavibacterium sp. TaxID=2651167 RepID=UPI00307EF202